MGKHGGPIEIFPRSTDKSTLELLGSVNSVLLTLQPCGSDLCDVSLWNVTSLIIAEAA